MTSQAHEFNRYICYIFIFQQLSNKSNRNLRGISSFLTNTIEIVENLLKNVILLQLLIANYIIRRLIGSRIKESTA